MALSRKTARVLRLLHQAREALDMGQMAEADAYLLTAIRELSGLRR